MEKNNRIKSTGYLVKTSNSEFFVVAENIAHACDILDYEGFKEYEFVFTRSFEILEQNY